MFYQMERNLFGQQLNKWCTSEESKHEQLISSIKHDLEISRQKNIDMSLQLKEKDSQLSELQINQDLLLRNQSMELNQTLQRQYEQQIEKSQETLRLELLASEQRQEEAIQIVRKECDLLLADESRRHLQEIHSFETSVDLLKQQLVDLKNEKLELQEEVVVFVIVDVVIRLFSDYVVCCAVWQAL
jgi:hypothetical protein